MPAEFPAYHAPKWLPGGHAQTIYPLLIKPAALPLRRERWDTPDGDFIDLDWLDTTGDAPLVVLFHGLEGSSASHYARALMRALHERGWNGVIPHFRGCSGELNRQPRAYHSGDSNEIDWILRRLRQLYPQRTLYVAGVSLGGNALLKWLGEQEGAAEAVIEAAAAICAPLDLAVCGHTLAKGFNRVYTQHFLSTLKVGAAARLNRHPALFDERRMRAAGTLYEFDDVVTGPLHGYRGADDYWRRASAKPLLPGIRVATLVLNARNDPFVPGASLPAPHQAGCSVTLWQPPHGGHVGFPGGRFPAHVHTMPEAVLDWLARAA